MQDLQTIPFTLSMTSREIAKLTGKEHFNVLVDVRKMLEELKLGELTFQFTYLDSQNKGRPEYHLPKRETLILTSGYSVLQRAKIIDRWRELEGLAPHAPKLTPSVQVLVDLDLKQQAQQTQIDIHEQKLKQLDGDTGYMTALGYCRKHKIDAPLRFASRLGKACTRFSNELDIRIGRVADERWGEVNSYSVLVLDEVIVELQGEAADSGILKRPCSPHARG